MASSTANLPPTLTKSQVNSVRKHLKIQMLNLLKHPASYDYHENITTVLNDLGVTASEVRSGSVRVSIQCVKLGQICSSSLIKFEFTLKPH